MRNLEKMIAFRRTLSAIRCMNLIEIWSVLIYVWSYWTVVVVVVENFLTQKANKGRALKVKSRCSMLIMLFYTLSFYRFFPFSAAFLQWNIPSNDKRSDRKTMHRISLAFSSRIVCVEWKNMYMRKYVYVCGFVHVL